jgi:hypothetical protein
MLLDVQSDVTWYQPWTPALVPSALIERLATVSLSGPARHLGAGTDV